MNCEQIEDILNNHDVDKLAVEQRDSVEKHLSSCPDCAFAWSLHLGLCQRPIPEMPEFMERWRPTPGDARAVSADTQNSRSKLVVPMLLLGGVAAATAVYQITSSDQRNLGETVEFMELQPDPLPADLLEEAEPEQAIQLEPVPVTGSPPGMPNVLWRSNASGIAGAADASSSGESEVLAVLPSLHIMQDPVAVQAVDAVYAAMINELRTIPGLEVIELTSTDIEGQTAVTRQLQDLVTERHGSDLIFRLGSPVLSGDEIWGISRESWRGGAQSRSGSRFSSQPVGQELYERGIQIAWDVARELVPESGRLRDERIVANTALPESQRVDALFNLRTSTPGRGGLRTSEMDLKPEVLEAVIILGVESQDPRIRWQVWDALSLSDDEATIEPLLQALEAEPDETNRLTIVQALGKFQSNPAVRETLEQVSRNDLSPDVRFRANWASRTRDEQLEYVSSTLLDTTRPLGERMKAFRHARGANDDIYPPGTLVEELLPALTGDALDVLVTLHAQTENRTDQVLMLRELGRGLHPEFLRMYQQESEVAARENIVTYLIRRSSSGNPGLPDRDPEFVELLSQLSEVETDESILSRLESATRPVSRTMVPIRRSGTTVVPVQQ